MGFFAEIIKYGGIMYLYLFSFFAAVLFAYSGQAFAKGGGHHGGGGHHHGGHHHGHHGGHHHHGHHGHHHQHHNFHDHHGYHWGHHGWWGENGFQGGEGEYYYYPNNVYQESLPQNPGYYYYNETYPIIEKFSETHPAIIEKHAEGSPAVIEKHTETHQPKVMEKQIGK